MSDTLKPCPFCGGEAYLDKSCPPLYQVMCTYCAAAGQIRKNTQEAVLKWNRRVVDDAVKMLLEQLRETE